MDNELQKGLMPVSEEELNSAYGCKCNNCLITIRRRICCYKDCYDYRKNRWTSSWSTSQ